jgi:hypothetical protein
MGAIPDVDATLELFVTIKESGTVSELVAKYSIEDWENLVAKCFTEAINDPSCGWSALDSRATFKALGAIAKGMRSSAAFVPSLQGLMKPSSPIIWSAVEKLISAYSSYMRGNVEQETLDELDITLNDALIEAFESIFGPLF